ncbi:MAG: agmatine deiminase [Eubacteriales bacterium]
MERVNSVPARDGFWMPAEYEPHDGCILIWPERADSWPYGAVAARKAFCQVIEAIARWEKVTVCASDAQYDTARRMLPSFVRVVEMSSDDAWARDCMPTFVRNAQGQVRGVDWQFNAWGGLVDGLYFPWDKDDRMARKMCDLLGVDVYDARPFVMEGGALHVDGEGTAMVTEACLLSEGRNPQMSRQEIEETLRAYLGVDKVLWLPRGIYNDETNEHVDNVCAFVRPGEVVLAWTDDPADPQYEMSRQDLAYLESQTDARGRKLTVHKLPLPAPVTMTAQECEGLGLWDGEPTREEGERLAASYVNFYIANGGIVMPAFDDPMDEVAAEILRKLFPDREVVSVYARDILVGGGNIHCITQQIPKGGWK